MKAAGLLKGLENVKTYGDGSVDICGMTSDSRKVKPGYCFICIKGYVSDGHEYINKAVENGAVMIVAEDEEKIPEGLKCFCAVTEDTRYAAAVIADNLYDHPSGKMTVIGVTGTKGKTTTTYMIKRIMEAAGYKTGLIGTMKNMVGNREIPTDRTTPEAEIIQELMSEMVNEGVKVCIMEVSSQGLHLKRVDKIDFDIGIFTNLSEDHLGPTEHPDMESYAKAKARLFTMCKKGIINTEDPYAHFMTEDNDSCMFYTVGDSDSDALIRFENVVLERDRAEYDVIPYNVHINVSVPGIFTVYNSLEAFTACVLAGVDYRFAAGQLTDITVPGKAEVVPTGSDFTVMIDYAHNPNSFKNIIETVKMFAKRTVFLFGCGGDRNRPRKLMGKTAGMYADFAIITSDNPRSEDPASIVADLEEGIKETNTPYVCIVDRKKAIEYALYNARPGDVIILAGKGHETYQILKDRTIHFDEREVVREILDKMKKEGVLR